ncbi:MAG: YtxH domain-containing protein [Bacteroidota bacterium]
MNTTSKVILGIVGAAAVGAVIGMLVAPEKGSDLRKKISEATGDLTSQLSHLLATGKKELKNLKDAAMGEGKEYASEAGDRYNKVKDKVS